LLALEFTPGTPLQLTLQHHILWLTVVTDDVTWLELCEASQDRQDVGADWVQENDEVIIDGYWLTESGITHAEQLVLTAAPGIIRVQLRELGFRA
jgi:hypothetical protein